MHAPQATGWMAPLLLVIASTAFAADDVATKVVLQGLDNPCGVAIRPGGAGEKYEIYVADSGGGRIVKLSSDKPGSSTDVVTGFPTAGSGPEPLDTTGPRGLLFLGPRLLLAVCGGGDQPESVRLYELPADNGPMKWDAATRVIDTTAPEGASVGHLCALARTHVNDYVPDQILVTSRGGQSQGWIGKASVRADALGELSPFVAAAERSRVNSPAGIAVGEKGYVVVGQQSDEDASRSVLVFYNPIDGTALLELETQVRIISGLAYSRATGNLYATDFAVDKTREGDVFRIDDTSRPGEPSCRAVRMASVGRPTALAFGPDGALYVSACGRANGQGAVVRLSGSNGAL